MAKLVERDIEVGRIAELIRGQETRGRVLILEAEAGLGKTTLLEAARGHAIASNLETLSVRSTPLDVHSPWAGVRQLLRDDAVAVDHALAAVGATGAVDANSNDIALNLLLRMLIRRLAPAGGVLLVDDAHWCDEESLRFLTAAATWIQAERGALIVATRPDGRSVVQAAVGAILGGAATERIKLQPLSDTAARELVESRLGAVGLDLARSMQEATRGNPLLLDLLSDAVLRIPPQQRPREPTAIAALAADALPRPLLSRLAAADDASVALAAAIAVLGDGAGLGDVAELAGLTAEQASLAADRLTDAGLLVHGAPLSFVHPLVRDAVYATLSVSDRDRAHRGAARMLTERQAPLTQVAGHLMDVRTSGDAALVETMRAAAREALQQGAIPAAIDFLGRALQEPPAPDRQSSVLYELGVAEASDGRPSSIEHLHAALRGREPDAEPRRAVVLGALLQALTNLGGGREEAVALALADPLLEPGGPDGPMLETQLLILAQTTLPVRRLVIDRVQRLADARLDGYDGADPRLLVLAALEGMGTTAPASTVVELVQRACGDGRLVRSEPPDSSLPTMAVCVALHGGALELAESISDLAVARAESGGWGFGLAQTVAWQAHLRLATGDVRAARADAERAYQLARHDLSIAFLVAGTVLIDVLLEAGEVAAAAAIAERGVGAKAEATALAAPLIDRRGRVLVAAGRPREALNLLAECDRFEQGWGMRNPTVMAWREPAQRAARLLGEHDLARELADEHFQRSLDFGAPHKVGRARAWRSIDLDRREAVAELEIAVAELEGARLLQTHARRRLGLRLAQAGREAAGRDVLRIALADADRCGATALVASLRRSLRSLGSRPRRAALAGVDALTPSERRVAALAARGLTNTDIAGELVITVKTVEMHLSRVYRKLDVRRDELSAALDVAGPLS